MFFVRVANKRLRHDEAVRVAAKGLKVSAFSISCRGPVRVADKEATGEGREI
jgi:hypothetical protein